MKKKITISVITLILLLLTIVFWQEYSFRKNLNLKIFEICMETVPSDILQDYEMLKINTDHCKNLF
jgi:hypothetical protein